jgi:hypothetical protein
MGYRIYDKLALRVPDMVEAKLHEFTTMDADSNHTLKPGKAIMVRMAASHWGYINKNLFYYDPTTVNNSLPTWTKPRPKPVLTGHPGLFDSSGPECIGRILSAAYTTGVAAEFVDDDLIPNNRPHGYLEFSTKISDQDAIQKVIDKRYDTVSISAVATNVLCSICNTRIDVSDEECKHDRGKRYNDKGERATDGKLCYYKAGPLLGRHVAFVHMPGDQYAGVIGIDPEEVAEDAELLTLSSGEVATCELWVIDAAQKLLISMHNADGNVYDELSDGGKRTIIDIVNNITLDRGVEVAVTIGAAASNSNDKEGESMENEDKEKVELVQLADTVSMTEADLDTIVDKLADDAKLSYQARKNLPDSAFCGPGRSFPAHDAAHVRNGLARLNQSNYTGSQKSSILSCLRGRAKKYGIKVSTKTSDEGGESKIESITVIDVLLSDATIEDMIATDTMSTYLKSLGVTISAEDVCSYVEPKKEAEAPAKVPDAPVAEPEAPASDQASKVLEDSLKVATAQNVMLMERIKTISANKVVDLRIKVGKATNEDRESMVKELMIKSEDYINDLTADLEADVVKIDSKAEDADPKQIGGSRDDDAGVTANNKYDLLENRFKIKVNKEVS